MLEATTELPFAVLAKAMATPRMVQLRLRRLGLSLDFQPGQYILLSDADGMVPPRSYSIANAPRPDGTIDLLVSAVPGGETSGWVLNDLAVGEPVSVAGPYGTFTLDPLDSGPRLYLAGGAGLAPIMALLESSLQGEALNSCLIVSARTEADVACRDRLLEWQTNFAGFRSLRTLTRADGPPPLGRVPTILPDLFPSLDGYSVFSAGGPGFVDACAAAAIRLGAAPERVRTEAFFSEPQPW
ncbi:MAG: FAD-binding oxidoreductase [Candidatus Dormibacteria bacterium]